MSALMRVPRLAAASRLTPFPLLPFAEVSPVTESTLSKVNSHGYQTTAASSSDDEVGHYERID